MNRIHSRSGRLWMFAALGLCGVMPTLAREPIELVPGRSVLVWHSQAYPDTSAADGAPSALGTLLEAGARIAGNPLKPGTQLLIRTAETFALAVRYPMAIAVIDASAKPARFDPQSAKLDRLRVALIVKTDGKSEPFRRIIQKVVNELTDDGQARLTRRQAGDWPFDHLIDRRIDTEFAWGDLGDCFVFGYGPGVWEQVAAVASGAEPALVASPWYREVRGSNKSPPQLEILVEMKEIRERLDPFVNNRATAFLRAWQADGIEQAAWFLGFDDRDMYCVAHFREGAETRRRVFAHRSLADAETLRLVPDTARYAIYRMPMSTLLPRVFDGFYATRGPRTHEAAQRAWQRIVAALGFDPQRDLLEHLGDTLLIHNDPPHPLRLPLAFTVVAPIRDDAAGVRSRLESVCEKWAEFLAETPDEAGVPSSVKLEREDDGVWAVSWGPLVGIAWTSTDRYLIASWSPAALREYMERMGDRLGPRTPPKP